MDLLSGQPFWLYKNGFLYPYPTLTESATTEVVVMGGGITGALVAWHLTKAGFAVTVLDKRHIGMGSTAGSTALLQYEIDTMLTELAGLKGEKDAVRAYTLCLEAIDQLAEVCQKLPDEVNLTRHKSIYYASRKADLPDLAREFTMRERHGFPVEWWDADTLRTHFPNLNKPGAIVSHKSAQVDAFRLAHALLQDAIGHGAQVFDRTEVADIKTQTHGIQLRLTSGLSVRAKKLIIACGYESQQYLSESVVQLHSTYALATKPIGQPDAWYENAMLWETARPYLYVRTTDDNRVLIGGKDEPFQSAVRRDRLLPRKTQQLIQTAQRLFPNLNLSVDYAWCGTFGETQDGLPYIGPVPNQAHTYAALGFGGNGILFSVLAAHLLTDTLKGRKNPDSRLFAFDR